MNRNEECEIVEDLLYTYNEGMLNPKSGEFVNKHIENCDKCKNKLEAIKSNLFMEKNEEKKDEEIELKHLLKINRVMRFLKVSLAIIILLLFLLLGITFSIGKHREYVINNAYNEVQKLKNLDNYKLTREITYIDNETGEYDKVKIDCFYKDGKYKELYPGTTFFFKDDSKEITYIFDDLKRIEKTYKLLSQRKGEYFDLFTDITSIYDNQTNVFQKAFIEIKNKNFNGRDCYVIRQKANNNEYKDIWIDKENFNTVKVIENYKEYYRETMYFLTVNEIEDSDVTLDMDEYKEYTVNNLINNN